MTLTKNSGYYINLNGNDIFIKTVKYYIKDKDIRSIMLRLNMINIENSGIKQFRESLIKAILYTQENGVYKLKIKNNNARTLDDVVIINLDSFNFGGGKNE